MSMDVPNFRPYPVGTYVIIVATSVNPQLLGACGWIATPYRRYEVDDGVDRDCYELDLPSHESPRPNGLWLVEHHRIRPIDQLPEAYANERRDEELVKVADS